MSGREGEKILDGNWWVEKGMKELKSFGLIGKYRKKIENRSRFQDWRIDNFV